MDNRLVCVEVMFEHVFSDADIFFHARAGHGQGRRIAVGTEARIADSVIGQAFEKINMRQVFFQATVIEKRPHRIFILIAIEHWQGDMPGLAM